MFGRGGERPKTGSGVAEDAEQPAAIGLIESLQAGGA